MAYVMYPTKSDIKGFVCIFVIVDRLTKLLPGLFMIVLLSYYALFIVLIVIFMNYFGLLSAFLMCFVRQILQEKPWIPDKSYFVQPCQRPTLLLHHRNPT